MMHSRFTDALRELIRETVSSSEQSLKKIGRNEYQYGRNADTGLALINIIKRPEQELYGYALRLDARTEETFEKMIRSIISSLREMGVYELRTHVRGFDRQHTKIVERLGFTIEYFEARRGKAAEHRWILKF